MGYGKAHNSLANRKLLRRLDCLIKRIIKRRIELSEVEWRILEEKWLILEEKRLRICQMHPEWPLILKEAVTKTIVSLPDETRKTLWGMTEKELIRCHWALGRRIRNCFGLWTYNVELLESCGSLPPDEASMVIIKAVWRTLKNDIEEPNE